MWEIYGLVITCLIGVCIYTPISQMLSSDVQIYFADFLFNWAVTLAAVTIYSEKLAVLAFSLFVTGVLAVISRPSGRAEKKQVKQNKKASPVRASLYKPFITIYRSAMMVLTITCILAVDFPVFPRRFAKTETWGTSVMDLGVGSFVFSMGVISVRRRLKRPDIPFFCELKDSIVQTSKILVLGLLRLISVKRLNYQEHVTEYGVHWNFFFTLGLLPFAFTLINRIPSPIGPLGKAVSIGLLYELALKNTGLQEWIIAAARVDLLSQNKEGIASFAGYLAIFMVGYSLGLKLFDPKSTTRLIVFKTAQWAIVSQIIFSVLTVATSPSRRIANLPYVVWIVEFNSGIFCIVAAMETYFGIRPSPSYEALNSFGELMFLIGNLTTGLVNMSIDTVKTEGPKAIVVLLAYQLLNLSAARLLMSKRKSRGYF